MPQLEVSTFVPQLVWLAITFVILYLLMARIGLPRVGGVIEARRRRIDDDLARAAQLKSEAEAVLAAYQETLAKARAEAQAAVKETTDRLAAEAAERQRQLSETLARADRRGRAADRRRKAACSRRNARHRDRGRPIGRREGDRLGRRSGQPGRGGRAGDAPSAPADGSPVRRPGVLCPSRRCDLPYRRLEADAGERLSARSIRAPSASGRSSMRRAICARRRSRRSPPISANNKQERPRPQSIITHAKEEAERIAAQSLRDLEEAPAPAATIGAGTDRAGRSESAGRDPRDRRRCRDIRFPPGHRRLARRAARRGADRRRDRRLPRQLH